MTFISIESVVSTPFVNSLWGTVRRKILGISPKRISFSERGFQSASKEIQLRLERVAGVFLDGYHLTLQHGAGEALATRLEAVDLEVRGFAYEGAAMGLNLLDTMAPWRRARLPDFLHRYAEPHTYLIHIGAGWVWGFLPFGEERSRAPMDPLLRWLGYDGWGFYEGFFQWRKYVEGQEAPVRVTGYGRRVFDHGLGRAWWFVNGGNPDTIAACVRRASAVRQSDLWCGVGLAATYAGQVSEAELARLSNVAGPFSIYLAQGAVFAAKTRERGGNLVEYTDIACRTLAGISALEAARLCDSTLENLPADSQPSPYEVWRLRVQEALKSHRPISSIQP